MLTLTGRRHRAAMMVLIGATVAIATPVAGISGQGSQLTDTIPVFKIEAVNCSKKRTRLLTGVVVEGIPGIVTALHGVIGCEVLAHRRGPEMIFEGLKVLKVDVARDVAVLSSDALRTALRSGKLRGQRRGAISGVGQHVAVVGFPQSVPTPLSLPLTVEDSRKKLSDLVPAGVSREALARRHSPELAYGIVTLSGFLQPGHSGAPIVDTVGRVVAIGNGGLGTGIGWGFALDSLDLRDVSERADQMAQLTSVADAALFSVSESSLRPTALRPVAFVSGAVPDAGWDIQARIRLPFWAGGQRIGAHISIGALRDNYALTYETLPGLAPAQIAGSKTSAYAELGLAYHLLTLPQRFWDPYVRLGVGQIGTQAFAPKVHGVVGLDLLVRSGAFGFLEFDVMGARVPAERMTFNPYGGPHVAQTSRWVTRPRAIAGVGFSLGGSGALAW